MEKLAIWKQKCFDCRSMIYTNVNSKYMKVADSLKIHRFKPTTKMEVNINLVSKGGKLY